MANMDRPAYQGKQLTPSITSQQSQGHETELRSGHGDPSVLRRNEPPLPEDRKLGSGNSGRLGSSGKSNYR